MVEVWGTNVYLNPQNTKLTGPVLVHNSLGAADTDLGTKWMLPYHASLTTDGSGNVTIIDADGTQRVFTKDATSTPQTYTANKEDAVLISTRSKTVEVCSRAPFLPAPRGSSLEPRRREMNEVNRGSGIEGYCEFADIFNATQ